MSHSLTYEDECTHPLQPPRDFQNGNLSFCEENRCSFHLKNAFHRGPCLSCFKVEKQNYSMNNNKMHRDACDQTCSDWSYTTDQQRRGMCGAFSWSVLPIVLSFTSVLGFMATYLFAKSNCHIEKWILPYLSYTGTEYPESMVFGMILNTEGFLGLTVVFLGWRYYQHMGQRGYLNHFTLLLGALSCFGVIMVGNFQVTKAQVPHYIGAGLAFIIGTSYCIMTSVLSKRAFKLADPPLKFGTCVAATRIAIAFLMVVALTCLSGVGMYKKFNHRNKSQEIVPNAMLMFPNGSCPEILSKVPPYVRNIDLLGSITEWILTACLLLCLSLFGYEFQTFHNVKVVLLRHDGPLRCARNCDYQLGRRSRGRYSTHITNSPPPQTEVPATRRPTHTASSHKSAGNYTTLDSRLDVGEIGLKANDSPRIPSKNNCHNATTDSGIEDFTPLGEDSISTVSVGRDRSVLFTNNRNSHSRSLPNLMKIETV